MPKHIRNISGSSVSSFKYQLDKLLNTIPDIPCVANYDNSLENSVILTFISLMVSTPCDLTHPTAAHGYTRE